MARRTTPSDLLEDARLWDQLLALGGFDSEAGAHLHARAEAALGRLPADLDAQRVGAILDLYLRSARGILWRNVEKLSAAHLDALLAKLAELGPPYEHTRQRELQHRVLLAAAARGRPVALSAAELLRRESKFRHVPEALSKLRAWKDVSEDLLEVLDAVVEEQQRPPSLTETVLFWSSVFLAARRSDSSPGLGALRGRLPAWKSERMGEHVEATFARVMTAARP